MKRIYLFLCASICSLFLIQLFASDISVTNIPTVTSVPIGHTHQAYTVKVSNAGEASEPGTLYVSGGGYSEEIAIPALANGESVELSVTGSVVMDAQGSLTLQFTADVPNDETPDNNTCEQVIEVTEGLFASDNGTCPDKIQEIPGYGGHSFYGNLFSLKKEVTLESVTLTWRPLMQPIPFFFEVRNLDGSVVYTSSQLTRPMVNIATEQYKEATYEISSLTLPAGDYVFGIKQTMQADIGLGCDMSTDGYYYAFLSTSGTMTKKTGKGFAKVRINVANAEEIEASPWEENFYYLGRIPEDWSNNGWLPGSEMTVSERFLPKGNYVWARCNGTHPDVPSGTEITLETFEFGVSSGVHQLKLDVQEYTNIGDYQGSAAGPQLYIDISTDGGINYTLGTRNLLLDYPNHNNLPNYTKGEIATLTENLTPYIGKMVKARIRAVADAGKTYLLLHRVELYEIPTGPNIVLSNIPTLTMVPLRHIDQRYAVEATNKGLAASSGTLQINGTPGAFSEQKTIPALSSGQSQLFVVNGPVTASDYGNFILRFEADIADDYRLENNVCEQVIEVTGSTFAKDNGTYYNEFNASGYMDSSIGHWFTINQEEDIESFTVTWAPVSYDGERYFKLTIINEAGTMLYESNRITRPHNTEGAVTENYSIAPTTLPAGTYFFGVKQFESYGFPQLASDGAPNKTSFHYRKDPEVVGSTWEFVEIKNLGAAMVQVNILNNDQPSVVQEVYPAHNAIDVVADDIITATFNVYLINNIIDLSKIYIQDDEGNKLPCEAGIEGKVLTIDHLGFEPDTHYEVVIPDGTIKNMAEYRWSFTSAYFAVDIMSVTPEEDAQNVKVWAPVEVEFNQTITLSSEPEISIKDESGNLLPGTITPVINQRTLSIIHDRVFASATTYTVTIKASSVTGLAEDYAWSFTTETVLPPHTLPYADDLSEGFDDWAIIDANNDGIIWKWNQLPYSANPYCMGINTGTNRQTDDYLLLKAPVSIPSEDCYFQLDVRSQILDEVQGEYQLEILMGETDNLDDMQAIGYTSKYGTDWQTYTIPFGVEEAGDYYFAIRAIMPANPNPGWVQVSKILIDAGIVEGHIDLTIEKVYLPESGCSMSEESLIGLRIYNGGEGVAYQYSIEYDIEGLASGSEAFSIPVLPKGRNIIYLENMFDFSENDKVYEVSLTVVAAGDTDSGNNTMTGSTLSSTPLELPIFNSFIQESDMDMFISPWAFTPPEDGYVGYIAPGENYNLITKCMDLEEGDHLIHLAYWAGYERVVGGQLQTVKDIFDIKVGLSGTDMDGWQLIDRIEDCVVDDPKNYYGHFEIKEAGQYKIAIIPISTNIYNGLAITNFDVYDQAETDIILANVKMNNYAPYTPLSQLVGASADYTVSVRNNGKNDETFTIELEYEDEIIGSKEISLLSGRESDVVMQGNLQVANPSLVEVTAYARLSNDSYTHNNSATTSLQAERTTLGFEDIQEDNINQGAGGYNPLMMGYRFDLVNDDFLHGFTVGFYPEISMEGTPFKLAIYKLADNGNKLGERVYEQTYERPSGGFETFPTDIAVQLEADSYFMAAEQLDNLNIGIAVDGIKDSYLFDFVGENNQFDPATGFGHLALRGEFGQIADLLLDAISWDIEYPKLNDELIFSADVKNNSIFNVQGDVKVDFYVDNQLIGSSLVDDLQAGASAAVKSPAWTCGANTGYIVKAIVNDDEAITEINHKNNSLEKTMLANPISIGDIKQGVVYVENQTLIVEGYEGAALSIYNLSGQMVTARSLSYKESVFVNPGSYIVKITDGDSVNSFKILIK